MLYSQWPRWLQAVVVAPHVLFAMFATLVWWPNSKEDRRRFTIAAAYLLLFYFVMHFMFKA